MSQYLNMRKYHVTWAVSYLRGKHYLFHANHNWYETVPCSYLDWTKSVKWALCFIWHHCNLINPPGFKQAFSQAVWMQQGGWLWDRDEHLHMLLFHTGNQSGAFCKSHADRIWVSFCIGLPSIFREGPALCHQQSVKGAVDGSPLWSLAF